MSPLSRNKFLFALESFSLFFLSPFILMLAYQWHSLWKLRISCFIALVWSCVKTSYSLPTLFPLSPDLPVHIFAPTPAGWVEPRNRSLLSCLHITYCNVVFLGCVTRLSGGWGSVFCLIEDFPFCKSLFFPVHPAWQIPFSCIALEDPSWMT